MNKIIFADAIRGLSTLPDGIVDTCITSPPYYGLRDYGVTGQIGLESDPDEYINRLVDVFREVRILPRIQTHSLRHAFWREADPVERCLIRFAVPEQRYWLLHNMGGTGSELS